MTRVRLAPWLPQDTPTVQADIVCRALSDVGICEDPLGSNRSSEIDTYLKAVGCPVGQPWCAAAVAAWFRDSMAKTPPTLGASTDRWMAWAKDQGLWTTQPGLGYAVVFGKAGDAEHIGVVVRLTPRLLTVEGNTSVDAGQVREGIAVDLRDRTGSGWILGYVRPVGALRTPYVTGLG